MCEANSLIWHRSGCRGEFRLNILVIRTRCLRDSVRQLFEELYHLFIRGEFDPGSGRTLAACLTHASLGGSGATLDHRRTGA